MIRWVLASAVVLGLAIWGVNAWGAVLFIPGVIFCSAVIPVATMSLVVSVALTCLDKGTSGEGWRW